MNFLARNIFLSGVVGFGAGFRFGSVKDINSMTKTAETFHTRKGPLGPLDADHIFCIVRPFSTGRRLYQILTLIRIALVLAFILVAAASVFAD